MYLLQLIKVTQFILRFFSTQKQFNEQFIDAYLQPFYNQYGRSLSTGALQKIKKYYCMGVPITCASYARIYGRSLSENERELATLTGIITPLIDDFTDEHTLDNNAIDNLTGSPATYIPHTLEEAVVKNILCELINRVASPEGFLEALHKTIQAQHWSAKQMNTDTPTQELLAISLEKGAWSHIFFHYLNNEIPTKESISALHLMGGLLQLSNDFFDVYKDYKEGIATYANTCTDYKKLEKDYLSQCREFCKVTRALPYTKNDVAFFMLFMASIMGRGLVALRMLRKLQTKLGGGALPMEKLDRKQLICDMEKPANMLRTVWMTYKITRN
jgi:hypothetical protein